MLTFFVYFIAFIAFFPIIISFIGVFFLILEKLLYTIVRSIPVLGTICLLIWRLSL